MTSLLDVNDVSLPLAAELYVQQLGVGVFPLLPGTRLPHTRHGFKDATTDPEQVRWWWERHPDSNIGIPTGGAFADVLDVDHKSGTKPGIASFVTLRAAGLAVGSWAVQSTPTGGMHILWRTAGLGCTTRARIGLDVRGAGGYIVAAPSKVPEGRYRWERVEPERCGAPLPWQAICDLLDPRPVSPYVAGSGDASELAGWLAMQGAGNRNNALHWAACRVVEAGEDPEQLRPAARLIGLPDQEISRTINSARHTGSAA